MAAQPSVVPFQVGALPCVRASVPKATGLAGGLVACALSAGTTWHSLQSRGARKAPVLGGFTWNWWAPTAVAGDPEVAAGGAAASCGSVPARFPVRPAVPWQEVQLEFTSARPFRWVPEARLMVPSAFTDDGWHWLQVDAVTVPEIVGWPVGGIPWHETQVRPVAVQRGVALAPETPLKTKLPWQ